MWEYIIVITVVVIGYYIYINSKFVTIQVNNNSFQIEKYSPNRMDSLNRLVEIRAKLDQLIKYMEKTTPKDPKVPRLKQRFKTTILRESNPTGDPNQTSYTINKGSAIVLCLRLNDQTLVDINTLTYVAVHELTHIYSSSYHHTDEFWTNMSYMEKMAEKAGIYKPTDFTKTPTKYCGLTIRTNVPTFEHFQTKVKQYGGHHYNPNNPIQFCLSRSSCHF